MNSDKEKGPYVVDRIEEGIAVCQHRETLEVESIPIELLSERLQVPPIEIKENDIFIIDESGWHCAPALQVEARNRIQAKFASLKRKK